MMITNPKKLLSGDVIVECEDDGNHYPTIVVDVKYTHTTLIQVTFYGRRIRNRDFEPNRIWTYNFAIKENKFVEFVDDIFYDYIVIR